MKKPINIALAADAEYLIHARVTLCSLFDSNKNNHFAVYLFTESINHLEVKKIKQLAEKYNNSLKLIPIDKQLFENFFVSGHVSVATYYRLLIPDMLPEEVEKVLYLDTDIIIKKDITALWETNLQDNCLAAVDEENFEHLKRLQLSTENGYFNAGVLLIDVSSWRELRITKRGLEIAKQLKDRLVAHDQDILNILLSNKWLPLPKKWNQAEGHSLGRLVEEPTMIHFVGFKPWTIHCIHPYKKEYYYYYYKMEGNGKRVKDLVFKIIKAFQNRILFKFYTPISHK